ncbi:hydroxyectoine utilization dehydratase EutB [Salsuginibacillus kocurii]|uniref:hydroxyectoine utilization dehydratase EutB n=1 Tax=Salsuginibacillus kocurii TaxID=427078 RepID=UPI00037912DF|nr:hydroxyectoine utilization dehydratase EutB [Salsuginibacillus kocurii]
MTTLSAQEVWQAYSRIHSTIISTPCLYSPSLSQVSGVPVYLKLEQFQPSGSFKLRGAANHISSLSEKEQKKGVTTFSTGNHGLAVAYAAQALEIEAVVCVSAHVPEAKIEALKKSGATLHIEGESQDEAAVHSLKLQEKDGLTLIPPFDHPAIIAGQGTIGLEILSDLPSVKHVVAGLSGGGLLGGISLFMKANAPEVDMVGLSVEKGAAMDESLRVGKVVEVPEHPTYADSLLGGIGMNNLYTFPLIQNFVDQRFRVPEETIAHGMVHLFEHHKLVVEGAAAIGVGALLDGFLSLRGPTVIVVTGAGIDPYLHQSVVSAYYQDDSAKK